MEELKEHVALSSQFKILNFFLKFSLISLKIVTFVSLDPMKASKGHTSCLFIILSLNSKFQVLSYNFKFKLRTCDNSEFKLKLYIISKSKVRVWCLLL